MMKRMTQTKTMNNILQQLEKPYMCNKLKLFIDNDNEYSQQFYDNINKLHDYCTDKIILRQKSIVGYLN